MCEKKDQSEASQNSVHVTGSVKKTNIQAGNHNPGIML